MKLLRRRPLLTGATALAAYGALAPTARAYWQSRPQVSVGGAYVGPGDFATAAAAPLLRGYSFATRNAAQCVNVRRSSDNATQDFGLTEGDLDQNAIAAFAGTNATGNGSISAFALTFTGGVLGGRVIGAVPGTLIVGGSSPNWTVNISQSLPLTALTVSNALFSTKNYDQTGGGNDFLHATAANQPYLALFAFNGRAALCYPNNSAFRLQAASLANPWATGGWAVNTFLLQALPSLTNGLFHENTVSTPGLNSTNTGILQWNQTSSGAAGLWATTFTLSAATAYVLDVSYSQSALANVPTITVNGSPKSTTNTQPTVAITTANGICWGNSPSSSRSVPALHGDFLPYSTAPSAGAQEAIRQNSGAYYGITVA